MRIADLLAEKPKLHIDKKGTSFCFGVSMALANFIDTHVKTGMETIETGAGLTTLCFLSKGASHTAICPDDRILSNIEKYLQENEIGSNRLQVKCAKSQHVLHEIKQESYDFAYIDGDHAFPVPFIDYYFFSLALKVNGVLVIDDTQLWTGRVLKQFLLAEPEWKLMCEMGNKSVAFRKVSKTQDKGWGGQLYTVLHSDECPAAVWNNFKPSLSDFLR
jgi:hypothetical protein